MRQTQKQDHTLRQGRAVDREMKGKGKKGMYVREENKEAIRGVASSEPQSNSTR